MLTTSYTFFPVAEDVVRSVLLNDLITRHPHNRPSPSALPSQAFFSSLPISTLNFLDRSNFAAKTREEKISFMKGLTGVLSRFSEGLRIRKILPTLLEEVSSAVATHRGRRLTRHWADERHTATTVYIA